MFRVQKRPMTRWFSQDNDTAGKLQNVPWYLSDRMIWVWALSIPLVGIGRAYYEITSDPEYFAQVMSRLKVRKPDPSVFRSKTIGADFTLVDSKGNRVSLEDYRGKLVLLRFGEGSSLKDDLVLAKLLIAAESLKDKFPCQVMYVSVDGELNGAEELHDLVICLKGTRSEIAHLVLNYGLRLRNPKKPDVPPVYYGFVLEPDHARVMGVVNEETSVEDIVKKARRVLDLFVKD